MPELPEVEILVRHLRPLLRGRVVRRVEIRRGRILRPTSPPAFTRAVVGARFSGLTRRGKYLLFELRSGKSGKPLKMLGHLGMTGRMFMVDKGRPHPRHAAAIFELGSHDLIFEDPRYFGRLTLDASPLEKLGPEPLGASFTVATFAAALRRSRQAIKVKLLDQSVLAGVGNIYASEALHRARMSPRLAANRLSRVQTTRLVRAIRDVLAQAIAGGSTVPLNFTGGKSDGLYYFGHAPGTPDFYAERLAVYDRAGEPCRRCARPIRRIVQAARSTFYCPHCQISR